MHYHPVGAKGGEVHQEATASGSAMVVQAGRDAIITTQHHVSRSRFGRRTGPPAVDRLADQVRAQWESAAAERRLTVETLPVKWRRSALPVAVPVASATSSGAGRPRFEPLPGAAPVTGAALRKGDRGALYGVYAGLPSGRLVITGDAGSGKSAAAILLLLDALAARAQDPARTPVPVMFTLHGWDSESTPVREWLTRKLVETSLLRKKDVEPLIRDQRIAVLLDGFDEMPRQLRPVALRALSRQVDFRLVLLSRADEFADAARHAPLLGAAVVALDPVDPADAVDHLLRHVVSPPSPSWRAVAEEARANPRSPLAKALRRPLAVTLLRDTYGQLDQVDELLDRKRFPTVKRIQGHLLDKVIDIAYTRQPGGPEPRYTVDTARRALGHVAHRMQQDGSRELAWWTVQRWVESPLAVFVRTLVVWWATTLPVTLLLGYSYRIADGTRIVDALPGALALGFVVAVTALRPTRKPRRITARWWLAPVTRTGLLVALPMSVAAAFGITLVNGGGIRLGLWLALAVTFWFTFGTGSALFASKQTDDDPYDPVASWRQDTKASLAYASVAGLAATAAGLHFGSRFGHALPTVIAIGLLGGLAAMFSAGPVSTTAWPVFLSQVQLALRHRTPVRLVRFLEDARERGVLQAVGPVYQFRHAELQDRLAAAADG